MSDAQRLGVGLIGSGFNAGFHLRAFRAVREADVRGVWSPDPAKAGAAAAQARKLDVGDAKPYASISDMVADPAIGALWIAGPNHRRVENIEEIVDALERGRGTLRGIACEKPLARTVAEAQHIVDLVRRVGVPSGYLENQCFAPQVQTGHALTWSRGAAKAGRPYLARAAEEHSGPHAPWFWRGELQGGGVLNDMMCHSALLVRHLLTAPGAPRSSVRPVRVTAHIASLKWTRPQYASQLAATHGREVDYTRKPAEDFASLTIEFETDDGHRVIGEATTSWSFVGAGLRLSAELLGPEYSMSWNTLDSGLKVFFSREVRAQAGEDLIEKQNAEIGLMPVIADEAAAYGYENEDRHFVRAFLGKEAPQLTFEDGLEVVQILMAAYQSAEEGRTLAFPPPGLDKFVPAVARGTWKGGSK
ncbi:MAG TPA: Gfo/Idh/MocA family oxidoreductase [Steroidobacteraceae bacterium]|nr:Gfo/Idh/MocA family oxidoreductase [Steroidobacteraceae bacterium]